MIQYSVSSSRPGYQGLIHYIVTASYIKGSKLHTPPFKFFLKTSCSQCHKVIRTRMITEIHMYVHMHMYMHASLLDTISSLHGFMNQRLSSIFHHTLKKYIAV